MKTTPVEPDHRIQLPADWVAELGLEHSAALEKTAEGIRLFNADAVKLERFIAQRL